MTDVEPEDSFKEVFLQAVGEFRTFAWMTCAWELGRYGSYPDAVR